MAKYDLWLWPISIKYWLNDKWYELGRYEDLHSTWTGLKCIHNSIHIWGLGVVYVVAKSGWVVLRPQPEFLVHFLDLGGTKRLYCRWEKLSFTIKAKKSDLYSFVIWSKFQGYLGSSCFFRNLSTNLMTFLTRICTFCCQIPGLGIHKNADLLSLIKLFCGYIYNGQE